MPSNGFKFLTWQSTQSVEAQARVLNDDRALDMFGRFLALFDADLVHFALPLGQIDLARNQLTRKVLAQNGHHFFQFLGIARNKCDWFRHLSLFFDFTERSIGSL